jgi:predicted metal-dependent hydrolase
MKIRKPKFELDKKLVRHYFKGNIFSTHLANSLHVIFPEGEKFFIRSCRHFLPQIEDKVLLAQVKLFMGQEGMHSKAHLAFWSHLEQQGFEVQPLANFLDKTAFEGVEKLIYSILGKDVGSKLCLSMTAGFEHYTSLLAEVAFENRNEFQHLPKEMQQLWFWHAAEEIEHRSVAYDLLKHIDNNPLLKNSGFALASILLFFYAISGQIYFVVKDKESQPLDWPLEFLDHFESLLNPMTRKFLGNMAKYFKNDFHPNQMKIDHFANTFFSQNTRFDVSIKAV